MPFTEISYTFLGGVASGDNLTGSCILIEIKRGKKSSSFLIDAGLLQCDFASSIRKNKEIINHLEPSKLDGIIVTHAHQDHVGRIPFLVKNGFKGRIFCTKPTADLLPYMLNDSAKIQECEVGYLRKKAKKHKETKKKKENNKKKKNSKKNRNNFYKNDDEIQPLYTLADVENVTPLIKNQGFDYGCWIKLATGIILKFYSSGHVLGGAICVIKIIQPKKHKHIYLGFSGDLGRKDGIILPPPARVKEPLDYWVIESTYGATIHPPRQTEIKKLLQLVREAVDEDKKIIIPSFALERAQEIIYLLAYYMQEGVIPKIPIYLDSPMAIKISEIFSKYWNTPMFKDQGKLRFNPFDSKNPFLTLVTENTISDILSNSPGPYIVIAGSGMCDAGRVRNYLRKNLGDPKTIVCLIGYMAKGSLGRKLQDATPIIWMNKDEILVKATVIKFDSFSAHADRLHLVSYTKSRVDKNPSIKKMFIVHGEDLGGTNLKENLINNLTPGDWMKNIIIPRLNEKFTL
jgi:metallo-beta-lactamase family protein